MPAGTYNNFARDLGIPLNIEDALKIIFIGNEIVIDTAEVNGVAFLNNSSIGLYPISVLKRNITQKQLGTNKFISMLLALIKTFYLFPLYKVNIEADGIYSASKTSFIFVGNNDYPFELPNITRRKNLTDGVMSFYYTKCANRLCLIKFAVENLLNRWLNDSNFVLNHVHELTVTIKKKNVYVSLDGEVLKMKPPLTYKIKPASLKVIVPLIKDP